MARVVTRHPPRGERAAHARNHSAEPLPDVVRGGLGESLAGSFEHLALTAHAGETSVTGTFPDQAQLHGLLDRLRDLGIHLVSVNPVD